MLNEMNDLVVVDDSPLLLCVLSELFKEHGYTVRTASDGFDALALIRDQVPDILVSDLEMPGMSGFELLSVVRRRFPTIAVIAMSGAYSWATLSPGIAADGFYAKGSSSVCSLLKLLTEIDKEEIRESGRLDTPIWIPGLPIHKNAPSTTGVACPECFRVFFHSLDKGVSVQQESYCPHCCRPVQLAIVRQSDGLDKTGLQI